jgi:hypothetical protein
MPHVDHTTPSKFCPGCRNERPIDAFGVDRKRPNGRDPYCRDCKRSRNRDTYHRNKHKRDISKCVATTKRCKYGISREEHDLLVRVHAGRCAICGRPETMVRRGKVQALCIDHDHRSGKVRGLLCSFCNLVIGYAREDAEILRKATMYLEKERTR